MHERVSALANQPFRRRIALPARIGAESAAARCGLGLPIDQMTTDAGGWSTDLAGLSGPYWPALPGEDVPASQIRAVLSLLAVRIRDPSGLNSAELTSPAWPLSARSWSPVRASHTRVLS